MHWADDGLVLGTRRHGESGVILELLTRAHGRHSGLVHGGRSRRLRSVLQPGNTVTARWSARIDDHLGVFAVEPVRLRAAALIDSAVALYALATLTALLRLLPERDPHPGLYEAASLLAEHLADAAMPALFVRFELALLAELGYGLDLGSCVATGSDRDLVYVSPRSARAVSAAAGAPYKDRLLPLPAFLVDSKAAPPSAAEVAEGFALTEHFLRVHVLEPRGLRMLEPRAQLVALSSRG